jgi:phage tail protein X
MRPINWAAQLGSVLYGEWVFRLVRGELEQAERHAEEIRHLGDTLNEVTWKYYGSALNGVVCCYLGKFMSAHAHHEHSLSLWDPVFRASVLSADDRYASDLIHLSRTLLCLCYADQARLRRNEALAEAVRLSPFTYAFQLCQAWFGDWARWKVRNRQRGCFHRRMTFWPSQASRGSHCFLGLGR